MLIYDPKDVLVLQQFYVCLVADVDPFVSSFSCIFARFQFYFTIVAMLFLCCFSPPGFANICSSLCLCAAVCSCAGDSHCSTFDGLALINYMGTCEYLLAGAVASYAGTSFSVYSRSDYFFSEDGDTSVSYASGVRMVFGSNQVELKRDFTIKWIPVSLSVSKITLALFTTVDCILHVYTFLDN